MLLYHGTTEQRAEAIKAQTIKPGHISAWSCSDGDEYLYFWSPDELLANGEADEPEYALDRALQNAIESAHIQAAMSDDPVSMLTILVYDVDPAYILPDDSCENMEGSGAVKVAKDAPRKLVATYQCRHNSRLDAFYVVGLLDNHHLTAMPDGLEEAAQAIRDADAYLDLYDLDEPYIATGDAPEPDMVAVPC